MRRATAIFWAGFVASAVFPPALGGTIRHDRPDALFTSLAAQPQFDPVGRLTGREQAGSFLASGTLISEQWVLTAAHVVDGNDGVGSDVSNLRFRLGNQTHNADAWFVHPGWITSGGEANLFAGWDVALVRLDAPVTDVVPATLNTSTNELGQVATLVGFGATGTGLTGAQPGTAGVKRAGNNVVDIAGTATTPGSAISIGNNRMLAVDFDQPGAPGVSTLGSPIPLDLEFLTAPGDSGGGLFIEVGGQHLLAGVTSLGSTFGSQVNSSYGDRAAFTRVSQFIDWIQDTMLQHSTIFAPSLAGDFNGDGVVDAADFVVWRDSLGATGLDLPADGNGDGIVDAGDWQLWRDNFGLAAASGGGAGALAAASHGIPEPHTITGMLLLLSCGYGFSIRLKQVAAGNRHGARHDETGEDIEILSDTEFRLLLGQQARRRLRSGESWNSLARQHNVSPAFLRDAVRFAASSTADVLRSLLDDAPPTDL